MPQEINTGDWVEVVDPPISPEHAKFALGTRHQVTVIRQISGERYVGFYDDKTAAWLEHRFKKIDDGPAPIAACVCTGNQLLWGGCNCGYQGDK